jgi:hypothetical protein
MVDNMVNSVTFGKDQYHQHVEMERWCEENIGPGCWTFGQAKTWQGMGNNVWTIDSMFGHTTFSFKDPQHLMHFILRWS